MVAATAAAIALAEEPRPPTGNWRSQSYVTFTNAAWTGAALYLNIDVAEDGSFRGAALNVAARLCARAHGGEVVMTEATSRLAGRLAGLQYSDRGRVHLKNIPEPIHILQVYSELDAPAPRRRSVLPFATRAVGDPPDRRMVEEECLDGDLGEICPCIPPGEVREFVRDERLQFCFRQARDDACRQEDDRLHHSREHWRRGLSGDEELDRCGPPECLAQALECLQERWGRGRAGTAERANAYPAANVA